VIGDFSDAKLICKFGQIPDNLGAVRPEKLDWVRSELTRMRGQIRAGERGPDAAADRRLDRVCFRASG
jgi:hypothetical protein